MDKAVFGNLKELLKLCSDLGDTTGWYYTKRTFRLLRKFESRFSHSSETARQTLCVLPSNLHLLNDENINLIEDFFKNDLPSRMTLRNELRLWKREWAMVEDKNDLPKTIENTIQKMNERLIFYPNNSVILRLLLMLPVSAATIERSHSSLKSIKTKQRDNYWRRAS